MNKLLHCALAVLFVFTASVFVAPTAHAQNINTLSGWSWSSNIGWMSFSGPGYGVTLDMSTGALVGYAWAGNLGWIKFGGLSNFPSAAGTVAANATVNFTTGAVTGWALACAGTQNDAPNQNNPGDCSSMNSRADGDGWLSLSGTGYGINYASSGAFSGYMWGGMTGWASWNASSTAQVTVSINPPAGVLNATPNPVVAGSNTTLSWSTTNNPTNCALNSTAGLNVSGLASTSASYPVAVNSPTTFSMTCTNATGSGSASLLVSTTTSGSVATPGFVSMWLNNSPAMSLSAVKIHPTGKVTLNWDGSKFTSKYFANNPLCTGTSPGNTIPAWTGTIKPSTALNNTGNVVTLQNLPVGTYTLQLLCRATLTSPIRTVSSSSNPVTVTVTQSVIREQ